ncbi:ABC transporter permease [Candidatus Saccharibacteria bacterium]|nr:ABC transporter permease [Candidatus Saccharibacteria bacterium]NIV71552.1 ABC transporter permease subunit [Calditrichia bacterium]NIW78967.1 ABC transporter permease subunit [Calditrichia bacterium]
MSLVHNRPVRDILFETIPNTLQLTAVVFVLQFLLGLIFGIITALKRNSKIDLSISSILLFLYSVPGFWLALMLVMIFSLHLGWLPSSHMSSLHIDGGIWLQLADRLRHLVLPVTVLTMPFAAYTARFVRGSLSDVLVEDYIRTAIAYGINRRQVIFKYALKNALLPVATLMGMYLPFLLGGAVITEYIFAWPGMGRLTINAIFAHDFPIILASSFLAALAVVIGNMLSDLLYATIDPRIRLVK